jgi:calmodulin
VKIFISTKTDRTSTMASNFTKSQLAEFKEAFGVFDKDGSGTITVDELDAVMKGLGHNPTKQELDAIFAEVDKDGNGKIDFSEFLTMMSPKAGQYDEAIMNTFKSFDKDGSGKISHAELKAAMAQMGAKMSDAEIDEMIKVADQDGDGQIDYSEFLKIMKS